LVSVSLVFVAIAPTAAQPPDIDELLDRVHQQYAGEGSGELPDYIPALQSADPGQFGIAVVTVSGEVHAVGDADTAFAIMSAAKPFTLALVMQQHEAGVVPERIGVEPTGLPFNSVEAIEQHPERSVNPMVNAGALAAVSLLQGDDPQARWNRLLAWYSEFAAADLHLMEPVYTSVRDTGWRNRSVAALLYSYGRLYAEPEVVRDLYNRQSSVGVTARQLATMGAVLANGGVNPLTERRVMDPQHVSGVLAVMMMAGLYDDAGEWAWTVGLPAKSGVGGGIVAVVPGRLAIAAFSPLLDEQGNSVRAQAAIQDFTSALGLGLFGPSPSEVSNKVP
jgi:glutaminase